MSTFLHIRQQGHKCKNPLKHVYAGNVKAGELIAYGGWELGYSKRAKAYVVYVEGQTVSRFSSFDNYEFTNFNCACAKLHELGA
jgi:predicted small secreted protein